MPIRTFIVTAVASLSFAGTGLAERGGAFTAEQKLTASDGMEDDYLGRSVAISGDTALVGANQDFNPGNYSGSAYIYQRRANGSWSEIQKLTNADSNPSDQFGSDVAISGDTALVGAYKDDDNGSGSGSAYLYQRQADGSWIEMQKLIASDGTVSDRFGCSVAIDGDTALVGAFNDDDNGTNSGSAYLYQRQADGNWSEIQKITASNGAALDYFGTSVAIDGNTALVGAFGYDGNGFSSGSAYLYQRQVDGTWNETTVLTASDGGQGDSFGISVAISGDTVLVGAYGYSAGGRDAGGCTYLYERQVDGSWIEIQNLTASDSASFDYFGESVAISGDTALVGVRRDDDNGDESGSAYLYQRENDGSWSEAKKLTASDGVSWDYFGGSVAIDGDTALVGAYRNDDNGTDSGSAYIFDSSDPPATGACCVCTGCSILTKEQCADLGGQYLPGLPCDECPPPCLGDVTGDGQVNVADLLTVIANWNNCP